jgi:predicted phosphodiesterase
LHQKVQMSFQILSDLHLEKPSAYDVFKISPKAPYLALLGDIGVVKEDGFFPFIEAQLSQFQLVFFLLGNHEPYHSTWIETKHELHRFSASVDQRRLQSKQDDPNTIGSFVFLDQTRYDLSPDVTVLGCTLFSRVSEAHKERVSFGLKDFYHINDWTVEDHVASHKADLWWLNDQISHIAASESHRKLVVFTHHSPVTQDARAVDPRHENSPLSSGFATDLSAQICWKSPLVRLWAFGHTHFNVNYVEDTGKLVISNQRGYHTSQAKDF